MTLLFKFLNRSLPIFPEETIIFKPIEMIGIVDLRLVGYYKIKQGILQQNLSR